MKVNIYYGGRGMVDDPTIFVMGKIQEVLEELNVNVTRYNLYEMKNTITTLSQTVTEADAVVLATTVEWLGMGGYMQSFLDSCWLYGDKDQIGKVYMFPVVMAKTYGEREVSLALANSWEIIGGRVAPALNAYVDDTTEFEFNSDYVGIIENYAETIYRTVSQKRKGLPTSSQAIKNNVIKDMINFTPQESEQLSEYVSNDQYVQKQKEDIQELSEIFRTLLGDDEDPMSSSDPYIRAFSSHFHGIPDISVRFTLEITDEDRCLYITADGDILHCTYKQPKNFEPHVTMKLKAELLTQIIHGETTLQSAFRTGNVIAKGDFKILRSFDELFRFE